MALTRWGAFFASLASAVSWIKLIDAGVAMGYIPRRFSRKVVHVTMGPVFLLTWPWFPSSSNANLFAGAVPLLVTLQFFLVGLGIVRDDRLVQSSTREGRREELLRGPLAYGLCFVFTTVVGFRTSPEAVIALITLCAGDGMAETVGKAFGSSNKLPSPFCRDKSFAGTLAMVAASVAAVVPYMIYFRHLGYIEVDVLEAGSFLRLVGVCVVSAVVEAMTKSELDNVYVCASAWLAAYSLFMMK